MACVENGTRIGFKIDGVQFTAKFTASAADPDMTNGLDNEFGDVHYNTSNSRYWVKSEAGWRVQTPNVAFVHPGSGRRKLTWDQNNKRWRDHYQNSGRISEHPEGIVVCAHYLPPPPSSYTHLYSVKDSD